jgi:2-methylcitrate dehydratase PrpD
MKIKATAKDGRCIELQPRDPLGHARNPMKDDDVKAKFERTVEPVAGAFRAKAMLDLWWNIRQASASELAGALELLNLK